MGQEEKESYFPLIIKYTDSDQAELVYDPRDIVSGRGFKVIKTRADVLR